MNTDFIKGTRQILYKSNLFYEDIRAKTGKGEHLKPEYSKHMILNITEHLNPEHKHHTIKVKGLM